MNPRERRRYIIITLLVIFATFILTHMWTQDWMSKEPKVREKTYRYRSKPKYRSRPKYRRKAKPAGKININTATQAQLEGLATIGPVKAQAIIESRPYHSTNDIIRAKGIGYRTYSKLKNYITAGEVPPEPLSAIPDAPAAVIGKININTATQAQLESLPAIGPVKAQAIIAGRPYSKTLDIIKAKGIGKATYLKLKDRITVSSPSSKAFPGILG